MRQSGKDRAFAGLVKAFAASTGYSLRTAQRHAKAESNDWKRYVQGQAVGAVAVKGAVPEPHQVTALATMSPARPVELPEATVAPEDMSEPERVLRSTHEMWREHFRMWQACLRGAIIPATKTTPEQIIPADHAMALSHAAACVKLRDAYEKARVKFDQWEIEQRRQISVNEFAAMRSEFVLPLANMLNGMPDELCVQANPADSQHARRVLAGFVQERLKPAIENWITALNSLTPQAA